MPSLNIATRSDALDRMAAEHFDVLVIGGGITGLGVALDASARGYTVALVDKGDFGGSTSSKSTKLVHGGIRYLPQFDFALVHEALVERGTLMRNAPFLVRPLPFLLPLYEGAKKPLGIPFAPPNGVGMGLLLATGLVLYDTLAGRRGFPRHKRISVEQALTLAPHLRGEGLKETFIYYDGQTNDTRLVVAALRTASRFGAAIANYAGVTGFEKANGKLTAAHVHDTLGDRDITIRARHIVNAGGVFAERIAALTGDESKVHVAPSKGVHLIVASERVGVTDTGIVLPETDDGRILFIVPWEERAIIGTTDTGEGDLDHPEATPEDIDYLVRHVNRYLNVNLTTNDLISVYAGYRPLVKSRERPSANLSRTHVVVEENNGMVTIVGGKMTTYRRMAQDTVDTLAKRDQMPVAHPTEKLALSGAINWNQARAELARRCEALGLDHEVETSLAFNYGAHALEILDLVEKRPELAARLIPDLPFIRADVIYACREEMAVRLDDALARRMRIELEDRARGAGVVNEVARLMASELGWSENVVASEIEQYMTAVRRSLSDEGLARIAGPQ